MSKSPTFNCMSLYKVLKDGKTSLLWCVYFRVDESLEITLCQAKLEG